jgi:dCMP deaminase
MHKNKWQEAYMDTAERFASLSTARRLKVGAIIVKDNRIISIGYNGMPSGWDNECEECCDGGGLVGAGCYHDHCTGPKTKPEVIHAEANAIAKLARSTESGLGAEMYITHSPCIECAKQIYTAGVSKVFYKNNYRNEDGIELLKSCNIDIKKL